MAWVGEKVSVFYVRGGVSRQHWGTLVYREALKKNEVVVYLTLTDPLRIQLRSQDRRDQTKSNREECRIKKNGESRQKGADKKQPAKDIVARKTIQKRQIKNK